MFYYNPLDKACKSQTGAISRGCEVLFHTYYQSISGEDTFSADVCLLNLYQDDGTQFSFPMKKTDDGFEITLRFNEVGLYFYYFSVGDKFLGRGALRRAVLCDNNPESWQVTVYDENYHTPDWFKGGVMYQIFPDRFCKVGESVVSPHKILRNDWGGPVSYRPNEFGKVLNNDFFGGNLNGIRSKLPYLKSLHVNAIYLNPIFEAYSNHRYDTGDYMKIDGALGTVEDFEALTAEANALGIHIILDGVFNHTGDDSRYFNRYGRYDSVGAFQAQSSPYADWYTFRQFPDLYDCWWGIEVLPAVNEHSESYQEFICGENGVLKTWLGRGISGYRLDVADELPGFFLKKIRNAIKEENRDALIIGEVWEDASNKIAYSTRREYLQGYELDSVMNYPLKDGILNFILTGNTAFLREQIAMLRDNYPKETLDVLMNIVGTHDTPRVLTVMGGKQCADKDEMARTSLTPEEKEIAKKKVRMAALLQFTLPGVPCIYYGDEIGMEGYLDPFCRACFPWDDMDRELSVFYQKLGEIRTETAPGIFKDGEYRELFADGACLIFERRKEEKSVIVYCNNGTSDYTVKLTGKYRELLTGNLVDRKFTVAQRTCGILMREN